MAARRPRAGRRALYRFRDWAAYDRALARRDDITVCVSPDVLAGWRTRAGRRTFSDAAIKAALMVRAAFRLALRQAEGLLAPIFALLGVALHVPDHTTLSRRGRTLHLHPGPYTLVPSTLSEEMSMPLSPRATERAPLVRSDTTNSRPWLRQNARARHGVANDRPGGERPLRRRRGAHEEAARWLGCSYRGGSAGS
jgi:hypothetical protein